MPYWRAKAPIAFITAFNHRSKRTGEPRLISAQGLVKKYGKVVAVDGLDLNVQEGSVTGLIGPNGAGKTTTIKIILGLLKPDSGNIRVFDQDPWDNPALRELIGVVHEKAYFPSHQKVLDYLRRVCRIFGVTEDRAGEVLKLVGLEDAFDRQIKALSAGMLQKFAVAHAIIHKPHLVLADEMTANLDPQARSSLLDLVANLNKTEKTTFLLSSHILPELSRICDSVAIINRGKVYAAGKLVELYDKYAAGMIRITLENPEKLATEIQKLPYIESVTIDARGISVRTSKNKEENLYEDAARLAKQADLKILGIETGSASLEELYRLVVTSGGKEA
ncbi:MAG TPA: ABC transporter ATP-binding protein [Candidatus Acidoferrum sp.]|jgi:ABC-2 type transport system ATP-binding protein|nr:ABC transporter ATP-binding protein [Candidatus Acidoferrum sp.]